MSTLNISLPETMRAFIEERANEKGFGSGNEYVRYLIRRDQEREALRSMMLEGVSSAPAAEMTPAFFAALRKRVRSSERS